MNVVWSPAGRKYHWIIDGTEEITSTPTHALPSEAWGYSFQLEGFVEDKNGRTSDPQTFNRWCDFLELYVAKQVPMSACQQVRSSAPLIYQALKGRDQVPLFIGYVTVCIAVSLVVYVFFIKNKSETYLDREQGAAFR